MDLLKNVYVADMESTGLLHEIHGPNDLHVFSLCYFNGEYEITSTDNPDNVKSVMTNSDNYVVGHNFFLFDIPAFEKMLDFKTEATILDSLFISWYIEPQRRKHGLEMYGEEMGVPKPEIEDWNSLTYEEYKYRCEEDVKINTNLWHQQYHKLMELYDHDISKVQSILGFLMTKGKVYKQHYDNPLRLDVENTKKGLAELEAMIHDSEQVLKKVMPKVAKTSKRNPPKNMFKQDGTLSAHGERWHQILLDNGLPSSYEGEVEIIVKYEEPKPTSVSQVKDWLFSLGWKPEIFNESVLKDGSVRQVPQVKDKEKNLCSSVLKLVEKEPAIKNYEDLGIMVHRSGYLKGFLENMQEDGTIVAGIAGLTNTLRAKHRNLVNLPSPSAKYGKYIRSVLLPPEGHIMIGSDLSSLENTTRNNFVIQYDPDFVQAQSHPYYDSHLDIAVTSGLMTNNQACFYKWWKAEKKAREKGKSIDLFDIGDNWKLEVDESNFESVHHNLDKIRQQAKTVSYSALYGVGAEKLSKELKTTKREARKLLDAYWKINWSVRHFANQCKTKQIGEQMWVLNPLNGYWYSLRSEKDIFSTVNQSAGDYIFTLWQHYLMEMGIKLSFGAHDEVLFYCINSEKQNKIDILFKAIDRVNNTLELKVPVKIDYKIGNNYAECH